MAYFIDVTVADQTSPNGCKHLQWKDAYFVTREKALLEAKVASERTQNVKRVEVYSEMRPKPLFVMDCDEHEGALSAS